MYPSYSFCLALFFRPENNLITFDAEEASVVAMSKGKCFLAEGEVNRALDTDADFDPGTGDKAEPAFQRFAFRHQLGPCLQGMLSGLLGTGQHAARIALCGQVLDDLVELVFLGPQRIHALLQCLAFGFEHGVYPQQQTGDTPLT